MAVIVCKPWACATALLTVLGLTPTIHLRYVPQVLATWKTLEERQAFAAQLKVVYPADPVQFNESFEIIGTLLSCTAQEAQLRIPHCEPIVVKSNAGAPPWTYTQQTFETADAASV